MRPIAALGVVIALLGLEPETALADFRVTIDACQAVRRLAAPQGTDLLASRCGQRFSSRDPFIAIVTRIRDIVQTSRVDADVQIFDPSQTFVEGYKLRVDVEPEGREIWDVAILPIAASASDLTAQMPDFRADIIEVKGGRPLKERLGTWTVRVTVNRQSYPFSFTLEGP